MSKKHMGSSIDEFLKEEEVFEEAQAQAMQEAVTWQIAEAVKENRREHQEQAGGDVEDQRNRR